MAAVRYVCMSDLHLGAAYSVLSGTDAEGRPDPSQCSPALAALARGLRELLERLRGQHTPPTLVLLGDVLDMGLSPMGAVAAAFQTFARAVMLDARGRPLFAPRVLCVPGNHDHHLWRLAQDQHFQQGVAAGRMARDLLEHTPLFEPIGPLRPNSPLLTRLLTGIDGLGGARCDIVYPNLGLLDAARQRCVVMHHGHYLDPMYRVVSTLNAQAPGPGGGRAAVRRAALTVAQIEAQNGPWVDFLWSDLGSAGITGREAMSLYEVMRDAGASQRFSQQLARQVVARLSRVGTSGRSQLAQGITVDQLVLGALDATLGQGAQSQRDSYAQVMSDADAADLRWYLAGPVHGQLRREGLADPSTLDLAFVFGHTHKPFQDELPTPGYGRPVAIYNTGGWVMDQPTMASTQGAAAVFIDADLNLASLRLFNDPLNGAMAPVQAQGVGGFRDAANPLLAALADGVARTADAWRAFSDAAQHATEARAAGLLDTFFPAGAGGGALRTGTHGAKVRA
jgi:hypothetical protein